MQKGKFVVAVDRRYYRKVIRAGVPFESASIRRDLIEEMIVPGDELRNVSKDKSSIQCYHVCKEGKDTGVVVYVKPEDIWEFWPNE